MVWIIIIKLLTSRFRSKSNFTTSRFVQPLGGTYFCAPHETTRWQTGTSKAQREKRKYKTERKLQAAVMLDIWKMRNQLQYWINNQIRLKKCMHVLAVLGFPVFCFLKDLGYFCNQPELAKQGQSIQIMLLLLVNICLSHVTLGLFHFYLAAG